MLLLLLCRGLWPRGMLWPQVWDFPPLSPFPTPVDSPVASDKHNRHPKTQTNASARMHGTSPL